MSFVHLHLHTQYSLLDGAITHEELMQEVRRLKMPAVAMTDHGNLFGAVEFHQAARGAGVKPILGCEVYVAPGSRRDKSQKAVDRGKAEHDREQGSEHYYHLTLLAENQEGWSNLCRLVTSGFFEGFYYKPRIDKEILQAHHEGLIALSGCLNGEVSRLVRMGDLERAAGAVRAHQALFGPDHYFLEIQRNPVPGQEEVNEGLVALARKLEVPLVATADAHYLKREDAKAHDVLLCLQTGKGMGDPQRLKFSTDALYVRGPEELADLFHDLPEAVAQTVRIAERCNVELGAQALHFPLFEPPAGESLESHLERRAREGLDRRLERLRGRVAGWSEEREETYRKRLAHEISVIHQMHFSGYFLIVADFIHVARSRRIPVGPGRGSAAGSLVAYALGITDLDPMACGLLFERFLNPQRKEMPDIDVDFCMERRDEVIQYVTEKYGKDRVAQIVTFDQMKARAALRDVGRVLEMSYGEVDRIAKLIPPGIDMTIAEALEKEPRLRELLAQDDRVKNLFEVAQKIEGTIRHTSTHAAGVVISDRPLVEVVPLMAGPDGEAVTQFGMSSLSKVGLIKFDFLGLKTLTVIHRTLDRIRETRRVEVDFDQVDMNDPATYEHLRTGETDCIFQLESTGMRDLIRRMKPERFEDMIALVALYRPGPLESGMVDDFIERRRGKTPVHYDLPELEGVLRETHGVIVYQEQVMQIASLLADFSLGDADLLRRAMGKKKPEEMAALKSKFLEGARAKKIPPRKAERIYDLMEKFAGYGFNKSHSAAYAYLAFQTAYLKTHFPLEFLAAILSSEMGNADKVLQYLNVCRSMGIEVLPPDLNESQPDFTAVPSGEGNGRIRFGFLGIKNVGEAAIEAILEARGTGPFRGLFEFASRVDLRRVNRRVVESLIKAGAFDSSGFGRGGLTAALDAALERGGRLREERARGQMALLGESGGSPPEEVPAEPQWSDRERLGYEKEVLGYFLSGHPLLRYARDLERLKVTPIHRLGGGRDGQVASVAGVPSALREKTTKKGDRMAFVSLEDLTGTCSVTVFPDAFRKYGKILHGEEPVLVRGRLELGEEAPRVVAEEIRSLAAAAAAAEGTVEVSLSADAASAHLVRLKGILERYRGPCRVYVRVVVADQGEVVVAVPPELRVEPSEGFRQSVEALLGPRSVVVQV